MLPHNAPTVYTAEHSFVKNMPEENNQKYPLIKGYFSPRAFSFFEVY